MFACPPPAVAELEASRSPDVRVRRLFADPLGRHVLLSVQSGGGRGGLETFYLDGELKKARPLPKLKGLALTSVAWSPMPQTACFRCTSASLALSPLPAAFPPALRPN